MKTWFHQFWVSLEHYLQQILTHPLQVLQRCPEASWRGPHNWSGNHQDTPPYVSGIGIWLDQKKNPNDHHLLCDRVHKPCRNVVKVYNLNKHPGLGVIGGVALLLAVSDLLVPGKGRQSVDGLTGAGHLK